MKLKLGVINLALCLGLLTAATVVGITGCGGNEYSLSGGPSVDDESLKLHVRAALSNHSAHSFTNVDVNVFNGAVQLSGFVATSKQKGQAENIARGIQGVQKVVNDITVKGNKNKIL